MQQDGVTIVEMASDNWLEGAHCVWRRRSRPLLQVRCGEVIHMHHLDMRSMCLKHFLQTLKAINIHFITAHQCVSNLCLFL